MPERPVLTAHWRELLLLNFAVPVTAIEPLVPPGTEPDLYEGRAYISVVGFRFQNARLFGVPIPAHTRFDEINLRFYVRRIVSDGIRRAVVFVREIVSRRAVALTANWLYHENYIARPMRSTIRIAGSELAPGDTVEYTWQTGSRRLRRRIPLPFWEGPGEGSASRGAAKARWNRLTAHVAAPLALPLPGSLEEFFVEHYWGYSRGRDGTTREYRVTHNPWRVAPADNITWNCDLPATYDTPLADYLAAPPTSALIADGSTVKLFRGRPL